MIFGTVVGLSPRLRLTLPGIASAVSVDFIIDTGFDCELAIPENLLRRLDVTYLGRQIIRLADGSLGDESRYVTTVDWNDNERQVEILSLRNGMPLLGTELLADCLVSISMTDGGEITIEPLQKDFSYGFSPSFFRRLTCRTLFKRDSTPSALSDNLSALISRT